MHYTSTGDNQEADTLLYGQRPCMQHKAVINFRSFTAIFETVSTTIYHRDHVYPLFSKKNSWLNSLSIFWGQYHRFNCCQFRTLHLQDGHYKLGVSGKAIPPPHPFPPSCNIWSSGVTILNILMRTRLQKSQNGFTNAICACHSVKACQLHIHIYIYTHNVYIFIIAISLPYFNPGPTLSSKVKQIPP